MTLGPPPPGTWRTGKEHDPISINTWADLPFPRDLEITTKQDALPFKMADEFVQQNLTVLLFTSPVPSHPSAWLLERVYNSVRYHLPSVRIVILADGKDGAEPKEYVEFKNNVRERGWELVEFKGWHYHTLMLREALLNVVTTPLVMVGEHDWGLRKLYVDWRGIAEALLDPSCRFKLIQLRQNITAGWEYGYFGKLELQHGINLLPTICFQDSVHVANSDWYRRIASFLQVPQNLEGSDLTFFLHGGSHEKNNVVNGLQVTKGIDQMACYIPFGPMGRLYHLDGANVVSPSQVDGIGD